MNKPAAGKPKKTESLRVRMDAQLKMRLEHLATIYSLDVSDIARMAFQSYIASHQKPLGI